MVNLRYKDNYTTVSSCSGGEDTLMYPRGTNKPTECLMLGLTEMCIKGSCHKQRAGSVSVIVKQQLVWGGAWAIW